MNKQKLHSTTTLRFRRWSRVGYAVFCSLACSVTIGVLSVSVSDKSLRKSGPVLENSILAASSVPDFSNTADELLFLDDDLLQIQVASVTNISFDGAVAYPNIF